jgi:hypothetical protein
MNTNTATEYRNLPLAALAESVDERNRDEVLATYAAYLAAFLANDVSAIDRLVQYPLAYIGDGKTTLVDTFPIKPADLMAAKQWHDTKDSSYEVVLASATKAHVILRQATRIRADGSAIETVSAFYALTRKPSGWKFFALSDITIPA